MSGWPARGREQQMLIGSWERAVDDARATDQVVTGETWRNRSGRFVRARPAELLSRMAVLQSTSVFAAAPDDQLRALARRLRALEVPAGTRVLTGGESSTSIYFITSGSCSLTADRPDGNSDLLGLLGRGDFFGETALFVGEPSHVTAVAMTPMSLLVLDRQSFYAVLGSDNEIASELGRVSVQRRAMPSDVVKGRARAAAAAELGSIVSVYSPKGGVGRSMVALNLAVQLASTYPHQVVLIDLSFPFNQIALMANLAPATSLARAGQGPKSDFAARLTGALIQHPSGLRVLPGVLKNEEIELVNAELVLATIHLLRADHRYVVVDLGPPLTEVALSIFDWSDDIVMVVTAELAAAKSGADVIEILRVLGVTTERISLVLNNRMPKPALTRKALQRLLRHEGTVEIPYEGSKLDEAVLKGTVLVLDEPRGGMARAMRQIGEIVESHHTQPLPLSMRSGR